MKVLTWNVDFKTGPIVYDYIFNKIDPDVALLQEVTNLDTERIPKSYLVYWQEIGGKRNWGSAILIKNLKGKQYILSSDPGWVVCAKLLKNKHPLYLVSIHARLKHLGTEKPEGYVIPYLRDRIFKELLQIIKSGDHFIIGGDLNAGRMYDKFNFQPPGTKHSSFFDWLENDLGLVNCTMETYKREIQTVFTRNIRHPYQNDYILISPGLKNKLRKCYIPKRTEVENLSDHSPVIVELNI